MGRILGWVSVVVGVVVALVPVNAHVLGADVPCGPAIVAVGRQGDMAQLCRTPGLSWVLISAVLLVAGLTAVCWGGHVGRVPAVEVVGWSVVGLVLAGCGIGALVLYAA